LHNTATTVKKIAEKNLKKDLVVSKTVVLLSPCSLDDTSVKNQCENFFQKRFGGYKKGCTFAARFERETRT
jgi:hypothetical protein